MLLALLKTLLAKRLMLPKIRPPVLLALLRTLLQALLKMRLALLVPPRTLLPELPVRLKTLPAKPLRRPRMPLKMPLARPSMPLKMLLAKLPTLSRSKRSVAGRS